MKKTGYLYIYILIYLMIWSGLTLLFSDGSTVYIDVAENLSWANNLSIAYEKHPGLGVWLIKITSWLTTSPNAAGVVASSICLVFSLIYTYKLSRLFFSDGESLVLTALSSCIISYTAVCFVQYNQNVILSPFWVACCYYFIMATKVGKTRDWLLLSVVAALGIYSKFQMGLLLIVQLVYLLFIFRKNFLKNMLLALVIFLILLVPLFIWLFQNDFEPILYALEQTSKAQPVSNFILRIGFAQLLNMAVVGIVLLPLLIMLVLFKRKFLENSKEVPLLKRLKNPLVILALAPIIVFCVLQTIFAELPIGWIQNLTLIIIPALYSIMGLRQTEKFSYIFLFKIVIATQLIIFIVYNLFIYFIPYRPSIDQRNYGNSVAVAAQKFWNKHESQPLKYTAGYDSIYIAPYMLSKPWARVERDKASCLRDSKVLYVLGCDVGNYNYLKSEGFQVISSKECVNMKTVGKFQNTNFKKSFYIVQK